MTRLRNFFGRFGTTIALVGIVLIAATIHVWPFIFYSHHPLGYDTGFYRRYLIQPIVSFPNAAVPGLGADAVVPRMLFDLLRFTGLPTNTILYGSYISFFILIPLLVFLLLKKSTTTKTALIGALLVALSPVEYTAYWFMLWKNMWAICLLLLAFTCFEYGLTWQLILLDIAIATSHKTTAIIYLLTLGLTCIISPGNRKKILAHSLITALCFALGNFKTYRAIISAPVGIFLTSSEYFGLSLPLVIGAIIGVWALFRTKHKPHPILIAFSAVSIAFPLFHLPFFERVFIFTDIALVVLSAYGISYLVSQIKIRRLNYIYVALLCLVLGTVTGGLWKQIQNLQPLTSDTNLKEIEAISATLPSNTTILTTTNEAPWFEGWSQAHIAAPGMLQDRHNLTAWNEFWSTESTTTKIAFLNSFKPPLFIATFDTVWNLIGNKPDCVITLSSNLLYNNCDNSFKPTTGKIHLTRLHYLTDTPKNVGYIFSPRESPQITVGGTTLASHLIPNSTVTITWDEPKQTSCLLQNQNHLPLKKTTTTSQEFWLPKNFNISPVRFAITCTTNNKSWTSYVLLPVLTSTTETFSGQHDH